MGRRLFACNVGDSRVVLCRGGGQCVELTSDHKPSRPDEAARVRAAGGFILHKRVMGELAITRAFGDKSFKMGIKAMLEEEGDGQGNNIGSNDEQSKDLSAPLVSAEPEIASMVSKELFIGLLAVLHLRIPRSPHLLIFCTNLLRF
jgi:serine/threonine protein phosphatase PrpC